MRTLTSGYDRLPEGNVAQIRVGTLQYRIRPVTSFEAFEAQVAALVENAARGHCQLLVFPEYFTFQLLTLEDAGRPMRERIRGLARQLPRYVEMFTRLASRYRLHIAGGTIATSGPDESIHNDCYVFSPDGGHGVQGKLHLTRFEREEWGIRGRDRLQLFDTALGKVAIAICYDVEFPELARAAALAGARVLVVPSCTDDRSGFLRVRGCAQARAIENQIFVIQSGTVGSLPGIPDFSFHYGQAAILTPCDAGFGWDGIRADGVANEEMLVLGDLDMTALEESRERGPVQPLFDSSQAPAAGYGPGAAIYL